MTRIANHDHSLTEFQQLLPECSKLVESVWDPTFDPQLEKRKTISSDECQQIIDQILGLFYRYGGFLQGNEVEREITEELLTECRRLGELADEVERQQRRQRRLIKTGKQK